MNAGVALIQSYLRINGYFTLMEVPIIRRGRHGQFHEMTDVDVLAVRFPHSTTAIAQGEPGLADDLRFQEDPALAIPPGRIDVLIAEVKMGKPRINPGLLATETLTAVLARVGLLEERAIPGVVASLQADGEVDVEAFSGAPARIRIAAFGDGKPREKARYTVHSIRDAARFVRRHLRRYREVLNPVEPSETALGLLQLLDRLE